MSAPAVDLGALFDGATSSVVRVETLPFYGITDDDRASWEAFLDGRPRPVRSVLTDDYLRLDVAPTVARGVRWERLRLIGDPPSDYERWELEAYRESQAVGEAITIASRTHTRVAFGDFWIVDQVVVQQEYDHAGSWTGNHLVDPDDAGGYIACADWIREHGVQLNDYLAGASRIPTARAAG